MEMIDVQDHYIHGPVGIIGFQLFDIFREEILRVQTGQIVLRGSVDQALVLLQLDDPLAAGQDHLRKIKGLCDEIRCPHFNALHLRVLL